MSTDNKRIWILLDSSGMGGIETHVQHLASGLADAGLSVTVLFFCEQPQHPLFMALMADARIEVRSLDGTLRALWQQLARERPTLLHTHGYKAGILGRAMAFLLNIVVVTTYHAGETPTGRVRWYDAFDRHTDFLAALRFAVSDEIRQRLPHKATVIDNFIDTSTLPLSRGQRIAFVGRLSHEKGPDRFVQLAQRFPLTTFDIYGAGPLASTLRMHAPDNLIFHGQQQMSDIWPEIGLLILPSRFEGLPMAVLEAMGRGIPVIASNVGNLHRVIEHGHSGYLVEPGDDTGFDECLRQWLALDANAKAHLQKNCRHIIHTRYSSQAIVPQLLAHYWQIAKLQAH
jgi:glycosyltransferase involved in cell wall biosynthesis